MLEVSFFIIFTILAVLRPIIIPYLALTFLFVEGLGSTSFTSTLTITLGTVNVFPLDLLYLLASIFYLSFFIKILTNAEFNKNIPAAAKGTSVCFLIYYIFYLGKVVFGYFDGVALDTLIRLFIIDTSFVYFFLPFIIIKDIKQLKSLLYFATILSLIFPLCQPFLAFSDTTMYLIKGQGTFRLGYGDANVLLALGALALFIWSKKKYLIFLPMAGIMMLAHRSGYIAIAVAFMGLSVLLGKKLQSIAVMLLAIILMLGMLAVLQTFTNINILDKNLSRVGETFENTGTTRARIDVFPVIMEEFSERPLTGLSFAELNQLVKKHDARSFNITHPHNFVLASIVNTGVIGTFLLFLLLYRSIQATYSLSKTLVYKKEGAFLCANILFFIIYSAMNTTMDSVGYILWFLSGSAYWLQNNFNDRTIINKNFN